MDFLQEIWKQWKTINTSFSEQSESLRATVKQKIIQIESGRKMPILLFLWEQKIEADVIRLPTCLFLSFASNIPPADAFLVAWKLAVVTKQEIEFIFLYQMPLRINPLKPIGELLDMRDRILGLID